MPGKTPTGSTSKPVAEFKSPQIMNINLKTDEHLRPDPRRRVPANSTSPQSVKGKKRV